jgi:hypothetical protein
MHVSLLYLFSTTKTFSFQHRRRKDTVTVDKDLPKFLNAKVNEFAFEKYTKFCIRSSGLNKALIPKDCVVGSFYIIIFI